MKRVHRSLLTALVIVGLGGAGFYVAWDRELRDKQTRKIEASEAKRLFRFGRDQVERGRIFARGATVAFQRDPEWGWKIISPIETPADPTAIETAIDRMAGMRVEPVEGEIATYGLDRPEAWMEVQTGSVVLKLLVGPKNQMTDERFVTDGSATKVYLADASFSWSVDRPLEAFREHKILPVARDKIVAITSSSPRGLEWSLRKTPEGWTVTDQKNMTLPADEGELNLLIVALTSRLRAEQYLAEDGKLDDWKRKLEVTLDDGAVMRLRLGDYSLSGASGGELVAAWLEGTSSVIQVGEWARKDFTKTTAELRDRTISRFERDEARRIELWTAGKMVAAYERKDADVPWTDAGSGTTPAQDIPNGVLRSISRLRTEKIEKDRPSEEEKRTWQLDPPRRRIIVLAEGRRVIADVRLGKKETDDDMLIMEMSRLLVGHYGTRLDDLFPQ